jgi:Transposase zinc-binding domain
MSADLTRYAARGTARDIIQCRSAALGGHMEQCTRCSHEQIAYITNSTEPDPFVISCLPSPVHTLAIVGAALKTESESIRTQPKGEYQTRTTARESP